MPDQYGSNVGFCVCVYGTVTEWLLTHKVQLFLNIITFFCKVDSLMEVVLCWQGLNYRCVNNGEGEGTVRICLSGKFKTVTASSSEYHSDKLM